MYRLAKWMASRRPATRAAIQAAVTGLVAFVTTILAEDFTSQRFEGFGLVIFYLVFVIVLLTILALLSSWLRSAVRVYAETRERVLRRAHELTDRTVGRQIESFRIEEAAAQQILVRDNPVQTIRELVRSLHECVETFYAGGEVPGERVAFEATFMTVSYRDGEITIPAWANREGRAPLSLEKRNDDPTIYSRTVTADLYRTARPVMRMVEDTSDPAQGYAELYEGQTDRIRSSIVYPVLSEENTVLGTLVLHCDKPRFFRRSDSGYWRELFEIFSSRVALEKLRLDRVQEESNPNAPF